MYVLRTVVSGLFLGGLSRGCVKCKMVLGWGVGMSFERGLMLPG